VASTDLSVDSSVTNQVMSPCGALVGRPQLLADPVLRHELSSHEPLEPMIRPRVTRTGRQLRRDATERWPRQVPAWREFGVTEELSRY
jgi:hypothetical protein